MGDAKLLGADDDSYSSTVNMNVRWTSHVAVASGTLKSLRVKCATSGFVTLAIFSDNANSPGLLLASTPSTGVAAGWNTIGVSDVEIISGIKYWLANHPSAAGIVYLMADSGQPLKYLLNPGYPIMWANNPSGLTSATYRIAIAGWGEVVGGGGAGRLIGAKSRLIGGPSPLIGGPSPLIG